MRFYLVAVGRVRSPALREACAHYTARLGRYQSVHVREVKEAGRRARDPAAARRLEGRALATAGPRDARMVALSRTGVAISSVELAERVERWREDARDVAFVIGGAWGLDESILERADFILSLSRMTLPHELARLVLLEQLYRAGAILKGEPYHKGPAPA